MAYLIYMIALIFVLHITSEFFITVIRKIIRINGSDIFLFFSFLFLGIWNFGLGTWGYSQNNDNISLQGKSVMYNLGGKLFYGRPINRQIVSEKKIETLDSTATMKISKDDAFGKNAQQNLNPIKQNLPLVVIEEAANMQVRSKDAFGNYVYENINPLAQQKVVLMDENETVMRIAVTDAFGNFSFDNLNPDGNYRIQLQMENNPSIPKDDLIYFTNNSNEVIEAFKINDTGKFNYSLLSGELTKVKLMEAVEVKMEK